MRSLRPYFFLLLLGFTLFSCASKKKVLYIQDVDNYVKEVEFVHNQIQVNDILKITIDALVREAAEPYNAMSSAGGMTLNNVEAQKLSGYLVREDGEIELPIIGSFKAVGKTVEQVSKAIKERLINDGHLNQPSVQVRIINSKVTVLGEVNRPGTYNFTESNLSLFQALGMAGDLTIQGKRKNVLLVRHNDDKREVISIDLTSTDWFKGPYYFIKPNDVIIVNPNGPKVKRAGYIGDISTILSVASVVLSSIVIITNIR